MIPMSFIEPFLDVYGGVGKGKAITTPSWREFELLGGFLGGGGFLLIRKTCHE